MAVAGCGLIAFSLPAITARVFSRLSTEIPAHQQGRAMSAAALSSTLLTPLAPVIASTVFLDAPAWVGATVSAVLYAVALASLNRIAPDPPLPS